MPSRPHWLRLACPACSATTLCGPDQMLARLRVLGMLRREKEPSWELVGELFQSTVKRMVCERCGHQGLAARLAEDDWDDDGDDETWGAARSCQVCGQPIPAERLVAFPQTQCCVACQRKAERGEDTAPPDYCPQCGTPMKLQRRRGSGLTGYQMVCPECGR